MCTVMKWTKANKAKHTNLLTRKLPVIDSFYNQGTSCLKETSSFQLPPNSPRDPKPPTPFRLLEAKALLQHEAVPQHVARLQLRLKLELLAPQNITDYIKGPRSMGFRPYLNLSQIILFLHLMCKKMQKSAKRCKKCKKIHKRVETCKKVQKMQKIQTMQQNAKNCNKMQKKCSKIQKCQKKRCKTMQTYMTQMQTRTNTCKNIQHALSVCHSIL